MVMAIQDEQFAPGEDVQDEFRLTAYLQDRLNSTTATPLSIVLAVAYPTSSTRWPKNRPLAERLPLPQQWLWQACTSHTRKVFLYIRCKLQV